MRNYVKTTGYLFLILWTAAVLPTLAVFCYPQAGFRFSVFGLTEKLFWAKNFGSDGSGMYFTLLTVLLLSLFFGWIFSGAMAAVRTFCYRWSIFFLCLVLLKYGWMKISFSQFYRPDPNTLDSALGDLSKDMVYWSLVGSSYSYQLFLGVCELLIAGLLLFRRTRFLGLIGSVASFLNVLAVNVSFDISVKLLSLTCLLVSVLLLLYYLDVLGQMVQAEWRSFAVPAASHGTLWVAGVVVLLTEVLLPAFTSEQSGTGLRTGTFELTDHRRFYIHRMGYVILQENGSLKSYTVRTNSPAETTFVHGDHVDVIRWNNNTIMCEQLEKQDVFEVVNRKDELLKEAFHWTSDKFH